MRKTKTLARGIIFNQRLMALVAVVVAVAGATTYLATHAATQTAFTNSYLTVKPTTVSATLDRKNPNYQMMTNDGSGYTEGLLYGTGFTITNISATAWQLRDSSTTPGIGFYESSGGLSAGQVVKVHTYINPSMADGTYTGSAVLSYAAGGSWHTGPTISYTITLVDYLYTDYMTVKPLNITETLSRAQAGSSAYLFGNGITVTSVGATGFQIKYTQPTQGQGFYTSSSGIVSGQSIKDKTYINLSKPNGTYTGSAIVQYYAPDKQAWLDGPTVNYSITLVDTYYTDYLSISPLKVAVTLSRAQAVSSAYLFGPGLTIKNTKAAGYEVRYNEPTQGQGFYTSSAGLTAGQTATDQTYINLSKPNGTYTGSAVIWYDDGTGTFVAGPTVTYSITLTN